MGSHICPDCGDQVVAAPGVIHHCRVRERRALEAAIAAAQRRTFVDLVHAELAQARDAHDPINSLHEGYAVILEELDELWDEARAKRAERSRERMLAELVQIGAMAQRTAEDLGLVEP